MFIADKYLKFTRNPSIKIGAFYTGSSLFKSFVNIIAGFLVLHYVGPDEIGLWQTFFIANTFAPFLNFGVPTGLHREIPFLMGRGENENAIMLASSAKFMSFACAAITLFLLIAGNIYFFIQKGNLNTVLSFSGVFAIIALSFLHNYYVVLYRTNEAFNSLSKINILEGVILILSFPAIILWKYHGYIAYQVLNHLFFLLLLIYFNPFRTKISFRLNDIIHLAKIGMPIFFLGYLYSISKSFLKFAILYFGGTYLLGIFAPVFAIISAVKMLPTTISRFIYPKFSYQIGKTGNPGSLWKPVRNISLYLLVTLTIIFIPVIYLMPFLIENFFPKYVESILPSQMVILSAVLSTSFIGINALNSIKAFKSRLAITIIYLASSLLFPFSMPLLLGNSITGLAVAIILIEVIYFLTSWYITKEALLDAKFSK